MGSNSISAIHQFLLEPYKLSTTLLRNWIAIISQSSRTGDSMKDTMEHCKVSTSWKLLRNMARIRFKFGEEATISLLLNYRAMMQGILKMIKDIVI